MREHGAMVLDRPVDGAFAARGWTRDCITGVLMVRHPPEGGRSSYAKLRLSLLASVYLGGIATFAPDVAHAIDGTWQGPGAEWTIGINWSSATVPDNTATFTNNSAPTSVNISSTASINTIQFDAAAPAYFFTNSRTFNINGAGIINNSAFAPSFTSNSNIAFNNTSTAGNATITNNNEVFFHGASSAGNANIINNADLEFFDTSTAGNATITNNSVVGFNNSTTAGNATIINNSFIAFNSTNTAGDATITTGSFALTRFATLSTAGNAQLITNAGGSSLKARRARPATIRSQPDRSRAPARMPSAPTSSPSAAIICRLKSAV